MPLMIGLSMLVAGMQTAWYRTDSPLYLRMTKIWGKLFLINFAIGVATGIVQEFQFGMNWSAYSRFCRRRVRRAVGDGRPARFSSSPEPYARSRRPSHHRPAR
jgi:hypothetical protein